MGARHILTRLTYAYEGIFEPETVTAVFHDSFDRLADTATVTIYLPTLAERFTRERLDAVAQVQGTIVTRVPEVLFACTHNAGRSQIAAALARHYAGRRLRIRTGGTTPGPTIYPEVHRAMARIGLSLGEEFPKPLTDEVIAVADVVVTLGCGARCPVLPGRRYEDWPIADPAGASPARIAAISHDLDTRLRHLLSDLLPDLPLPAVLTAVNVARH
jgi:protein-tyrosine-phosphatase